MKFKILTRMQCQRDIIAIEKFECPSLPAASHIHGDYWNMHFATADRYRSTMYLLNDLSRRWQKAEVINWHS